MAISGRKVTVGAALAVVIAASGVFFLVRTITPRSTRLPRLAEPGDARRLDGKASARQWVFTKPSNEQEVEHPAENKGSNAPHVDPNSEVIVTTSVESGDGHPIRPVTTNLEEVEVRRELEGLAVRHAGSSVLFVDCEEDPCTARAEAPDLETLRSFLQDTSRAYSGYVAIEIRERLDPYLGRSFQAEMVLDTPEQHPVPTEPSLPF